MFSDKTLLLQTFLTNNSSWKSFLLRRHSLHNTLSLQNLYNTISLKHALFKTLYYKKFLLQHIPTTKHSTCTYKSYVGFDKFFTVIFPLVSFTGKTYIHYTVHILSSFPPNLSMCCCLVTGMFCSLTGPSCSCAGVSTLISRLISPACQPHEHFHTHLPPFP